MKKKKEKKRERRMKGKKKGKEEGEKRETGRKNGGKERTMKKKKKTLLHHGMVLAGVPYSEAALLDTQSGGTPYGPTHVSGSQGDPALTEHEITLARALGKRLALLARQLKAS